MKWVEKSNIEAFLNHKNYDVRVSGNGRWIDQKCTPDVVSIVADCIIAYADLLPHATRFTSMDIWHSEYTEQNILHGERTEWPRNQNSKNHHQNAPSINVRNNHFFAVIGNIVFTSADVKFSTRLICSFDERNSKRSRLARSYF